MSIINKIIECKYYQKSSKKPTRVYLGDTEWKILNKEIEMFCYLNAKSKTGKNKVNKNEVYGLKVFRVKEESHFFIG